MVVMNIYIFCKPASVVLFRNCSCLCVVWEIRCLSSVSTYMVYIVNTFLLVKLDKQKCFSTTPFQCSFFLFCNADPLEFSNIRGSVYIFSLSLHVCFSVV